MMTTLCPVCGWGAQIKPPCKSVMAAVVCDLNKQNWLKYILRHKGEILRDELPMPTLVRSERGGDPSHPDGLGRGNAREELVPVTVEEARLLLKELHDAQ